MKYKHWLKYSPLNLVNWNQPKLPIPIFFLKNLYYLTSIINIRLNKPVHLNKAYCLHFVRGHHLSIDGGSMFYFDGLKRLLPFAQVCKLPVYLGAMSWWRIFTEFVWEITHQLRQISQYSRPVSKLYEDIWTQQNLFNASSNRSVTDIASSRRSVTDIPILGFQAPGLLQIISHEEFIGCSIYIILPSSDLFVVLLLKTWANLVNQAKIHLFTLVNFKQLSLLTSHITSDDEVNSKR